MKRSIGNRIFRATRALLAPAILLWMAALVWLGMVWEELMGHD